MLSSVPAKINLIPFNKVEGIPFRCSPVKSIDRFREILVKGGIISTTRKTRGDDINAACGQLAGFVNPESLDDTQISLGQLNDQTNRANHFLMLWLTLLLVGCANKTVENSKKQNLEKVSALNTELGFRYMQEREYDLANKKIEKALCCQP